MIEQLQQLRKTVREQLGKLNKLDEVNALRVNALGRKGEITRLLRGLKDLEAEERIHAGKAANLIKEELEQNFEQQITNIKKRLLEEKIKAETIDVTLPGFPPPKGSKHPLSQISEEICDIFMGFGFKVAEGPEIELDYYNFEALNFPADHPTRDMQDSFYIDEKHLLRTHTSPVQVRVMEKMAPELPVKIIVPGRVYRKDDDATHSPMFHQIEGLLIDSHITFANLKGVLMMFAYQIFNKNVKVRYRPSFFPFTEPSAEMDISCVNCEGKGCRVCSDTGWLEILGAGMVHPQVLKAGGYDPEKVTGFAFGMGIERIAMLKYGINDLRLFFDNDRRFLQQF
ncbi:MAG: phenylalanine--tRNA ligase subunit alpha [Syntrophomonadaceae bacterium]|nr:phenylalanine--tRNA ligase subunit alpha [Syntrophomonadaceae bacterium]